MSLLSDFGTSFVAISRAAYKAAASKMRYAGLLKETVDWPKRAEICERCPMRVVQCGVSYCGKPFLHQIGRDPVTDGCGCPTRAKARDPKEHCPITLRHQQAHRDENGCNCKWCKQLDNQAQVIRTLS